MSANKKGSKQTPSLEEALAFGMDNMEALVKSSAILAKGAQDLNKMWLDMTRTSFANAAAAFQTLADCGDARKLAQAQGDIAKRGYDKFVSDGCKVSDFTSALAATAMEPIAGRYGAAVEKLDE